MPPKSPLGVFPGDASPKKYHDVWLFITTSSYMRERDFSYGFFTPNHA